MTDVPALARQLLTALTGAERAELIERLTLPDRKEAGPLPPRAAGAVCAAGLRGVARALNTRNSPEQEDLDELAEALFYGFDTFVTALEVASSHAEGSKGYGPAAWWLRASFDALNLRDQLSGAVRDGYDWHDESRAGGALTDGSPALEEPVGTQTGLTVPEPRVHPCVPCQDCGKCSCEYTKGLCQHCSHIRSERQSAAEDVARWKRGLADGKTYAVGSGGNRLHRWNCSSLNSPERGLELLASAIKAARDSGDARYVYWSRLPKLYSAEELRKKGIRKRHCALCGPDPLY